MLTLLLYVLIVGLVAALLFLVASALFGRSEELGPLPEGTTVTVLPAEAISGSDVRALRFQQVVRGYKAGEVDWALTRLAGRIDELERQLAYARAGHSAEESGSTPPQGVPLAYSIGPYAAGENPAELGDTPAPHGVTPDAAVAPQLPEVLPSRQAHTAPDAGAGVPAASDTDRTAAAPGTDAGTPDVAAAPTIGDTPGAGIDTQKQAAADWVPGPGSQSAGPGAR
ncbi:MAG: hypothetical protein JWN03_3845 [Nocardia sp.]|nr:hypothetical protein [Nocardia sp.]